MNDFGCPDKFEIILPRILLVQVPELNTILLVEVLRMGDLGLRERKKWLLITSSYRICREGFIIPDLQIC